MKRLFGLTLLLLVLALCSAAFAGTVEVSEANFPDEGFRSYLLGLCPAETPGTLDAGSVTALDLKEQAGIKSLKGIELLTGLESLDTPASLEDTALDLRSLKSLKTVTINSALKVLNVSGCAALEEIPNTPEFNRLEELYASGCSSLSSLVFYQDEEGVRTSLKALDVSNSGLTKLTVNGSDLENVKLDNCSSLQLLALPYNELLTSVDVSTCPGIMHLNIQGCSLASLDVSKSNKLTLLNCARNKLASLNLGSQPELAYLNCNSNSRLARLDVSGCAKLAGVVKGEKTELPSGADGPAYGWFDPANLIFFFCDKDLEVTGGTEVKVTSIELNKTEATLTRTSEKKNPTLKLKATASPEDADNPAVKWKSSNPKVATVDENGKVTALKKGTCTITCTAKDGSGVKATCKITVRNKLVTKITLNKKTASLRKGKTLQLLVKTVKPADAYSRKVIWRSSNKNVATVDKNGKVKGLKKGTCTITCTTADGSKIVAKCKITVK